MTYVFKCPKCGTKYSIEMPISKYIGTGHICTNGDCKTELVRDVSNFGTNTHWHCSGAYGVGNH